MFFTIHIPTLIPIIILLLTYGYYYYYYHSRCGYKNVRMGARCGRKTFWLGFWPCRRRTRYVSIFVPLNLTRLPFRLSDTGGGRRGGQSTTECMPVTRDRWFIPRLLYPPKIPRIPREAPVVAVYVWLEEAGPGVYTGPVIEFLRTHTSVGWSAGGERAGGRPV